MCIRDRDWIAKFRIQRPDKILLFGCLQHLVDSCLGCIAAKGLSLIHISLEYRRTGSTRRYHPGYECKWATNTVVHILENREYTGCLVNFRCV